MDLHLSLLSYQTARWSGHQSETQVLVSVFQDSRFVKLAKMFCQPMFPVCRGGDNIKWSKVLSKRSCDHRSRSVREFCEEETVGSGREAKRDRDGGLGGGATVNGGLGKTQKVSQRSGKTEEHQRVVGKGGERVQAPESQQQLGEGMTCGESP